MADPDLFQKSGERVIKLQLVDSHGLVIGNQGNVPGSPLWTDGKAVVQRIQLLDYLGNAISGIGQGTDLTHVYDEINRVEDKVDQNESDIEDKWQANTNADAIDEANLAAEITRSTNKDTLHDNQIAAINQFIADLPPFEDPPFITGDMFVFDGVKFNLLPVGTDGQNLGIISGMPAWRDQAGPGVLPIWVSEFPPVDHGAYPLWWDSSDDIASGGRLKFYNTQAAQFVDATPSGIPGAQGLPGPQGIPGPQGPPLSLGYVPANQAGDTFGGPVTVPQLKFAGGSAYASSDAGNSTVFVFDNNTPGPLHYLLGVNGPSGYLAYMYNGLQNFTVIGASGNASVRGTFSSGGNLTAPNQPNAYQEGAWTPVLKCGGVVASLNNQVGRYTKIGRQVFVEFLIYINNFNGGVGALTVEGFPFSMPSWGNTGALAVSSNPAGWQINNTAPIHANLNPGTPPTMSLYHGPTTNPVVAVTGAETPIGSYYSFSGHYST